MRCGGEGILAKSTLKQDYAEALSELLSSSPKIVMANIKSPFIDGVDPKTRNLGQLVVGKAATMLSAIVQLAGTVEDMSMTAEMMRRYPWRGRISRAKHLELNWFLFQNLSYSFKEKLKLVFDCQKDIAFTMKYSAPVWLKSELKQVKDSIGKHIRDRGNSVHSWNVPDERLDNLTMVELIAGYRDSGQKVDLPDHFFDVKGHYSDAKWTVGSDAKEAVRVTQEVMFRVLKKHDPAPKVILYDIASLIEMINDGKALLS